ncbi:protein-glutamate methylesterase/protein-glutamine glutaminase [Aestuariivirga litoralis]|uniref:protein-glutamate methylesterase/protein-glutamine glutaminase n=1 Tax=Aestuariivirga litoralis TaxID=2650924 RepID=UPI0018C5D2C5|nr:chemotaxis response regulator protein-glutamate methylesterase [Aestuariivirga litoralis]MBG1233214.1 chemotaxis response regulator protein-glutamate methylesterase [Aestuariivirga litoralis]
MSKVRVLIVDDSKTMQLIIRQHLLADSDIEVVGTADGALVARQMIKQLNPDVITLDVEMPDMNGIDFLDRIMKLRPMPVVMVSTLTAKGGEVAIEALSLGAVDCVVKPSPEHPDTFQTLALRVKAAARARVQPSVPETVSRDSAVHANHAPDDKIVAIGSSTGGVEAIQAILTKLPANCPPIVITQHMPPTFTRTLANRLDRICAPSIQEAENGAMLRPGHVYIAPGGNLHLEVIGRGTLQCRLVAGELVNGHCPSVDVLFGSVARFAGAKAVGVILTGMGTDGAAGLLKMRQAGASTIGQNEATCVVYGMPKAAHQIGAVQIQKPINSIAAEIMGMTNARAQGAA